MYSGRPTMLCLQYCGLDGKCTLILFASGKARYMGRQGEALRRMLQLEPFLIPSNRISPLRESTRTVRLQLDLPQDYVPIRISEIPIGCVWEPELFPAIQFNQWQPLCVNLFHSGVVMVLGRSTDSQLTEIRNALTDFVYRNYAS